MSSPVRPESPKYQIIAEPTIPPDCGGILARVAEAASPILKKIGTFPTTPGGDVMQRRRSTSDEDPLERGFVLPKTQSAPPS